MALITCPDCGGAVSDAAPACIHCGRPMAPARPAEPSFAAPSYAARPAMAADPRVEAKAARAASAKTLAMIGYALQVLAFAYFIPGIAGVVLAYLKRGDARGTWVESHFDWQIQTFWNSLWFGLGAVVVGVGVMWATESVVPGTVALYGMGAGLTLWYIYRIVRGALALNDEKSIA